MPVVRYTEVTEEGFSGGPVMPDTYDGSKQGVEQLRQNIMKAGLVGSLVANDFKSAMIIVPLLDVDPATGKQHRLLGAVAHDREERAGQVRDRRTASTRSASSASPRSSVRCSTASCR